MRTARKAWEREGDDRGGCSAGGKIHRRPRPEMNCARLQDYQRPKRAALSLTLSKPAWGMVARSTHSVDTMHCNKTKRNTAGRCWITWTYRQESSQHRTGSVRLGPQVRRLIHGSRRAARRPAMAKAAKLWLDIYGSAHYGRTAYGGAEVPSSLAAVTSGCTGWLGCRGGRAALMTYTDAAECCA